MTQLTCKGCGEVDTIVEISVVPRIVGVSRDDDGSLEYGFDEAFWEAETDLGYGCINMDCKFWHGTWGIPTLTDEMERPVFENALPLSEVAENASA